MGFATSSYRLAGTGAIAIASTAVLLWFGNGLDPLWPCLWFAMFPVLWFALRSPWWAAALVSALAMLLGGLNMLQYLHYALGLPVTLWLGIYTTIAVIFAGAVLLFRALALRGAVWSALITVPAAWVAMEYIRNLTTPHGTAGSIAYTQLGFLPFLQLASITGPWGMSFVLLLLAPALALALYLWPERRERAFRVAGATAGVIVLVLAFGAARLGQPRGETVRVGLVSSDERANANVADEGAPTERLFAAYAAQVEELAAQGARAIVLPEKLAVVIDPSTEQADRIFQSVADRTGATIVVGAVRVAAPSTYNEARVYAPHVAMVSYDKHHMLPPFESNLKPGTTITVLLREKQTWGVAICKDMDFTQLLRRYGEAGAGVMLVPAWDFVIDRSWHGHIAVMRGVEDGFSIVRSAKNGFLTVSDSRGRIVAEKRSNAAPFATLIADVPVEHWQTLYQRWGDWFAWVALGLLAWALVRVAWLRWIG
jgi:apolipoprotein N-acyltransferase